jgi:COMPASS component SPP1
LLRNNTTHPSLSWQKLRQAEIDLEKEVLNANFEKIQAEERDLRNRIEDVLTASDVNSTFSYKSEEPVTATGPLKAINGDGALTPEVSGINGTKSQANGIEQGVKKGKKRKPE